MALLCLIFTSMEESPSAVVCRLPPVLWSCIDEICLYNICMVQDQSVVIKSRQIYVGRGNFLPQFPLLDTLSLLLILGKAWEWKKRRLCQEQDWIVNQQNKWTYKTHITLQYIKQNCLGGDSLILTTLCQSFWVWIHRLSKGVAYTPSFLILRCLFQCT